MSPSIFLDLALLTLLQKTKDSQEVQPAVGTLHQTYLKQQRLHQGIQTESVHILIDIDTVSSPLQFNYCLLHNPAFNSRYLTLHS